MNRTTIVAIISTVILIFMLISGQTTASVEHGKALYEKNCAECHGERGRGDGPLANTLPEKPTDFTNVTLMKEHTDEELLFKIKKGVGSYMPGYEGQLSEEEMRHVVNYLRSIGVSNGAKEEFTTRDNPVLNDHASFTRGKEVYELYCYRCHGPNGKGNNGTYAQSVLTEPAPDLSNPALLNKTDEELFYIIKFGSGEMPSHGEYLSDEAIWQTVNYIRTFEGKEHNQHNSAKQEKSNAMLYAGILIGLILILYVIKRR